MMVNISTKLIAHHSLLIANNSSLITRYLSL